jgi:hypothetical protein
MSGLHKHTLWLRDIGALRTANTKQLIRPYNTGHSDYRRYPANRTTSRPLLEGDDVADSYCQHPDLKPLS